MRRSRTDALVAEWSIAAAPSSVPALPDMTGVARALIRNSALYEAGSHTRRTLGWRAPTSSPNRSLLSHLTTLRDRSRAATRNDGYAKGTIDRLVTNIIGTGVKPLSKARDPEFRRFIQALWLKWTDESDADGLLDWYGQQSQAVRCWLEAGEGFVRFRPRLPEDGLSVPLQIQVLEPELCPHTYNTVAANGNRVRAGIEFNRIGRRVAYWFHPSRPTDFGDFDESRLVRLPADSVIHLYDPIRAGQLRGVPHLTQALIRLNDLDKYDDATLLRQQLANMFTAWIRKPQSIGEGEPLNPLTGLPFETFGDDQVLSMEPGILQELAPGEEIQFSDPPEIKSGYADFVRQQLFHISAATGVPYETLTGDMSKVNDRTVRVILNEFRRRVQAWQHQIVAFQLCRRVWSEWLDRAALSGAAPIPFVEFVEDPEPWAKVRWMPQGWPYLHPVQDVQAQKEAIRSGLTSRSSSVSENGEDSEEIDREQADDNERADELGLQYDSDSRVSRAPAASIDDEGDDSADDADNPDDPEEEDDELEEIGEDEEEEDEVPA